MSQNSEIKSSEVVYAHPGLRVLALCVDLPLIAGLALCVAWGLGAAGVDSFRAAAASSTLSGTSWFEWRRIALIVCVQLVYFSVLDSSKWKGTPGKRSLGLRVTNLRGKRIKVSLAAYRVCLSSASMLMAGMPYMTVFSSRKRQALHDVITKTVVIRKVSHEDKGLQVHGERQLEQPEFRAGNARGLSSLYAHIFSLREKTSKREGLALSLTGFFSSPLKLSLGIGLFSILFFAAVFSSGGLDGKISSQGFGSPWGSNAVSLKGPASTAMDLAMPMLKGITDFTKQAGRQGALPGQLPRQWLQSHQSGGIESITYSNSTGEVVFRLSPGVSKTSSGRRATLLFRPIYVQGQLSAWSCGAFDLQSDERPKECTGEIQP